MALYKCLHSYLFSDDQHHYLLRNVDLYACLVAGISSLIFFLTQSHPSLSISDSPLLAFVRLSFSVNSSFSSTVTPSLFCSCLKTHQFHYIGLVVLTVNSLPRTLPQDCLHGPRTPIGSSCLSVFNFLF